MIPVGNTGWIASNSSISEYRSFSRIPSALISRPSLGKRKRIDGKSSQKQPRLSTEDIGLNFCLSISHAELSKQWNQHNSVHSLSGTSAIADVQKSSAFDCLRWSQENMEKGSCEYLNAFVENKEEQKRTFGGEEFVLPRDSAFVMSDLSHIDVMVSARRNKFRCILMDPPWENKSVARSKKYPTLSLADIATLPVPDLIDPTGCLVAVWVTNNPVFRSFILEELFVHWKAAYLTTWYWMKVDETGEMISTLQNGTRKPYEQLILGWIGDKASMLKLPKMATERMMVASVPTAHSRKPPIYGILEEVIGQQQQQQQQDSVSEGGCLELFARNLTPGWTSWGNEVLKFQHVSEFVSVSPPAESADSSHV